MLRNILKVKLDPNRIYGLDILRALAIIFVVMGHGKSYLPTEFHIVHSLIAFDGVSIFFVLSGFLIGGILIKLIENNETSFRLLKKFWIRRWFRTLPNYYLILILLVILGFYLDEGFSLAKVADYFVFSQNLYYPHPSWFFPEAWSLSVEEWFYILIPLVIFVFIRVLRFKPNKAILLTVISILFSVTLFRYYRFSLVEIETLGEWDLTFRKQVFTRLDSLMFGILGAYVQYYREVYWKKHKMTMLFIGLSIFVLIKVMQLNKTAPVDGLYFCVFFFTIESCATLLTLPFLSNLKKGKGFLYRSITVISLISYSMYLINLGIVKKIIMKNISAYEPIATSIDGLLEYGTFWSITILLSILLYKYYELPTTRLRDRFG